MRDKNSIPFFRAFVLVLVLVLTTGGMATAAATKPSTDPVLPVAPQEKTAVSGQALEHFTAVPGVYDPDNTGCPVAKWAKRAGERDQGNKKPRTHYGLVLQKNCATGTNAAAGADIRGEQGIVLTQLGFDYKGYCGAGAPRFDVYTASNFSQGYFVGCASGTATDLGNGFTRVRFQEEDFLPFGGAAPFRYDNTVIYALQIILDEQGQVVLDNIAINSYLIQKP